MAIIKSSSDHLTINADGASKDIKFQANGVEKASISSAGAFTSTTIDATKLTGALPAISGASLTGVADATKLPLAGGTMTGTTVLKGITETQTTKSASFTPVFTEGTVYSCTGTMTITMPTATAGKNFTVIHATATSITWAGTIKWNGGAAPTAGSGIDIYVFVSDGTNWYGMQSGTGFA
jgi:hypothetical protein